MAEDREPVVIDFRDLRPKGRGDRREGPRRSSEVGLHFAEQALLSHACKYVDMLLDPDVPDDSLELVDEVAGLAAAVATYREACDKVRTDREGSS